MTVKHLNTLRMISLGLLCVAAIAAVLMMRSPQWLPLLGCILLLLVWMRVLLARMMRLVKNLGYDKLDPERLAAELHELARVLKWPPARGNRNLIHRLMALLYELRGQYPQAVDEIMQIDHGKAGIRDGTRWDAARLYLREGKPEMAWALIQQVMAANPSYAGPSGPHQLHVMGLLHLERGELRQAEERLRAALALRERGFGGLNSLYDLARVQERLNQAGKAGELFLRAAALGPGTHLGQEAAKMADAQGTPIGE